jgi:hypothetical protein
LLALAVFLSLTMSPIPPAAAGALAQNSETGASARQREARKVGGLRAAAAVTGSYRTEERLPSAGGPAYLEELADLSTAIIVGSAERNVCRLDSSGDSISTVYTVRVESVSKGTVTEGQAITVKVPGGKVGFGDGTWAEVITPGFLPPQPHQRYVWFLREVSTDEHTAIRPQESGVFRLSQGSVSLYNLAPDRAPYVLPSGDLKSPLAARMMRAKLSPEAFLELVQRLR